MNYEIRSMQSSDGKKVLEILKENIAIADTLTEQNVPTWEAWDTNNFNICRFVLEDESSEVVGWCSLRPYSKKDFYSGVAEVSIYVAPHLHGNGLGAMLMKKLIIDSEEHDFWTLQLNILPDNKAAISLLQKFGFRIVGTRSKIAKIRNQWMDVLLMERRSRKVAAEGL